MIYHSLTHNTDPASPGTLASLDTHSIIARPALASILAAPESGAPSFPCLAWTGSFAQINPESAAHPDRLFAADPRSWSRLAWDALEHKLDFLLNRWDSSPLVGAAIIIRPHALHVVSDLPSIHRVLTRFPSVNVLIDPASMLSQSMLAARDLPDHLERILVAAASPLLPRPPVGVLLSNVVLNPALDRAAPVPLTWPGLLDPAFIRSLAEAHLPAHLPRVLLAESAGRDRDFLESTSACAAAQAITDSAGPFRSRAIQSPRP